MASKELLDSVLQNLPEDRVQEVLEFARFVRFREDRQGWQDFGRKQLARAYGGDEPEYGLDNTKPELGPSPSGGGVPPTALGRSNERSGWTTRG